MDGPVSATPEARLAAAGLPLPASPMPRGAYAPWHAVSLGDAVMVHVSGQTCRVNGVAMQGVCKGPEDVPPAREAAQIAMLNCLAALRGAAGELADVLRLVRVRGFIRTEGSFESHPSVLDAATELLQMAFPSLPLPARSAVGVTSLPDNAWIEIELEALVRRRV